MVRLYGVKIESLVPRFEEYCALLDPDRRARVEKRGMTTPGLHTLAGGLLMRSVLGDAYTKGTVQQNVHGKPYLPDGPAFNLSHAAAYAVLVTADADKNVGVDIERCREVDYLRLGNRCFHPDEVAWMRAAQNPEQAFFTLWTLKESYLKAEGCGFSVSPGSVCILPESETTAAIPGDGRRQFRMYPVFPGYCLSVCALEGDFCERPTMLSPEALAEG